MRDTRGDGHGYLLHLGICLLRHVVSVLRPVNFELSYKEGNSNKEDVVLCEG